MLKDNFLPVDEFNKAKIIEIEDAYNKKGEKIMFDEVFGEVTLDWNEYVVAKKEIIFS